MACCLCHSFLLSGRTPHSLLLLAMGLSWSLLQHCLALGSQPPSGSVTVLHRLQVNLCPTVDLHKLQRDSLCHHGLHHGLGGISAPVYEPSPAPPSLLSRGPQSSFTCSLLSLVADRVVFYIFPPLPKYIPDVPPLLPLGLALVHLGVSWHCSIGHEWSFWQLLTESAPFYLSSLVKPCQTNPMLCQVPVLDLLSSLKKTKETQRVEAWTMVQCISKRRDYGRKWWSTLKRNSRGIQMAKHC